jgi:small-conductance mechanosensitive channel
VWPADVEPITSGTVVLEVLMVVGVVVLPLPALALGALGVRQRTGRASTDLRTDRIELALLVTSRLLALLLLLALSAVTLLACIGGLVKGLTVPSLVYVFFVADLLIAVLVVLSFGRRDPRRARRPATPARR